MHISTREDWAARKAVLDRAIQETIDRAAYDRGERTAILAQRLRVDPEVAERVVRRFSMVRELLAGLLDQSRKVVRERLPDEVVARVDSLTGASTSADPPSTAGVHREWMNIAQMEACLNTLLALRSYADAAFDFLSDGFNDEPHFDAVRFTESYLKKAVLDSASIDLNLLQRAIFQRRPTLDGKITQQGATLYVGDILARHALNPVAAAGFVPRSAVVCHLARRLDIRLVPYYSILLVGLPFSTLAHEVSDEADRPTIDYLAIPHEVGHFLYWYGTWPPEPDRYNAVPAATPTEPKGATDGMEVHQALAARLEERGIAKEDWRHRWLEECFADIFGALIAGPVMVYSFQDLLQSGLKEELDDDTGEHPIALLRPLFQAEALRRMRDRGGDPLYTRAPDLLDAAWLAWCATHLPNEERDPREIRYELRGVDGTLSGQEILDALDPVVDVVLEILEPLRPAGAGSTWSGEPAENEGLNELMHRFESTAMRADEIWPQSDEEAQGHQTTLTTRLERAPQPSKALRTLDAKNGRGRDDEWLRELLFKGWGSEGRLGDIPSAPPPPSS